MDITESITPMKFITLLLPANWVEMPNDKLGAAIKLRLIEEIQFSRERLEEGRASARKKLGTPITIDGTTYLSRNQARVALGMSFAAFAKKYPKDA